MTTLLQNTRISRPNFKIYYRLYRNKCWWYRAASQGHKKAAYMTMHITMKVGNRMTNATQLQMTLTLLTRSEWVRESSWKTRSTSKIDYALYLYRRTVVLCFAIHLKVEAEQFTGNTFARIEEHERAHTACSYPNLRNFRACQRNWAPSYLERDYVYRSRPSLVHS